MAKYKMKYIFGVLLIALAIAILIFNPTKNTVDNCQLFASSKHAKNLPASTSQVLVVKSLGGFRAELTACQLQEKVWQHVLTQPFLAVIGEKGVAPEGEKREGDMKTPVGFYPFGEAFGWLPLALKMDYKFITSDDKFIDDPSNKQYNTWVTGKTDAKSYEPMLISAYRMGVVINYNMNPTIPGAGSAIFMHLWQSIDVPTFGCVAMDEQHLLELLHWLDKKQHPHIYITM